MESVIVEMRSEEQRKNNRAVAIWLLIGVGMTVIQILLGGITRLTGSGLSITEWNVVTGALPPISEQQWLAEFGKYQQTPQYHLLNSDFNLHDFKFIFFWEWFHRLWARLIGVVFALGFVYFLFTRKFQKAMVKPLLILFLLGALQGAVGWIMVASGLDGDAVYVKPTRLALHFIFALFLLAYTFWFALQLLVPKEQVERQVSLRKYSVVISIVLVFQLVYGALMAGNKAATAAPTWPDINGQAIPMGMYKETDGFLNFINNKILVHFMHRGMAYLLLLLVIIWSIKAFKVRGTRFFNRTKWLPMGVIFLQVLLGIGSVLTSTRIVPNRWGAFEWIAQLHQFCGMLFLLVMVWMLFINAAVKKSSF
ncbi:MAG: COX15/CtaA family protein [Chitinophagaceae bacterium]